MIITTEDMIYHFESEIETQFNKKKWVYKTNDERERLPFYRIADEVLKVIESDTMTDCIDVCLIEFIAVFEDGTKKIRKYILPHIIIF